jgi:hypothetical protein
MEAIKRQGLWRLFDRTANFLITDEKQLERIIADPSLPFQEADDRGFSGERKALFEKDATIIDICAAARKDGATRLEVSYDFFFGGKKRTNYPDSETTLRAYRVIHDIARDHGLDFSASILSPLDLGGGYALKHGAGGRTCQFKEGAMEPGSGLFEVELVQQKQWTNNKGPIELTLEKVLVFAFREERLGSTPFHYVDPEAILDISASAGFEADRVPTVVSGAGYGRSSLRVYGKAPAAGDRNRCLAVAVYKTPELDYFAADAPGYMKGVIDLHRDAGIRYQGFYSDEMHIQFDWDLETHFGPTEIRTRYLTPNLVKEYARRYGERYKDFEKYLVYFAYGQHGFPGDEEGDALSQHVFGRDDAGIRETWEFRKRYFELLQERVVGLSIGARDYAGKLFGGTIMTKAHATWQESPTCDIFAKGQGFTAVNKKGVSRYDYGPSYLWSSSIRENMSACYDYFRWNDFLSGGGSDHPEGGFLDRNYYAQAFSASLGMLNQFGYAYCAAWGSPQEVIRRYENVATAFGNKNYASEIGANLVQGMSQRLSDVLALYPLDLNHVEERFGSWMVQYGYCDYITQEKLLALGRVTDDGRLEIRGRKYRTLLVLFEPFAGPGLIELMASLAKKGGIVLWTAMPQLASSGKDPVHESWKALFGMAGAASAGRVRAMQGERVRFTGLLGGVPPMAIPTAFLPDRVYPVRPGEKGQAIAEAGGETLGCIREFEGGGKAAYLGFRPRDDQSRSTGEDVHTLFDVLSALGAYGPDSGEALSRDPESPWLVTRFPNGAVTVANHYRTFEEKWTGSFFRDEEADREFLAGRTLPEIELRLDRKAIFGREISYAGTDILCYRPGPDGTIEGFAGNGTTGMTMDGREFRFTDRPCSIVWALVPEALSGRSFRFLLMARIDGEASVSLPVSVDPGLRIEAGLCGRDPFETREPVEFVHAAGSLRFRVGPRKTGQWIAFWAE